MRKGDPAPGEEPPSDRDGQLSQAGPGAQSPPSDAPGTHSRTTIPNRGLIRGELPSPR